jgi:hypothetical protein
MYGEKVEEAEELRLDLQVHILLISVLAERQIVILKV